MRIKTKVKSKLRRVAIVTPSLKDFMAFIRIAENKLEHYTWIHSMDRVRGRMFHRAEVLPKYEEIKDFEDIMVYLENHILTN